MTSSSKHPGRRVVPALLFAAVATLALAGCSTNDTGMGTITGSGTSATDGLTFDASAATGTGAARDYEVVIDHSAIDGEAPSVKTTASEYSTGVGIYGLQKPKTVTMKVTSRVKDGWASCDITWAGQSIAKKVSGKNPVAWCVATLGES